MDIVAVVVVVVVAAWHVHTKNYGINQHSIRTKTTATAACHLFNSRVQNCIEINRLSWRLSQLQHSIENRYDI
jgi:hypothetical protein